MLLEKLISQLKAMAPVPAEEQKTQPPYEPQPDEDEPRQASYVAISPDYRPSSPGPDIPGLDLQSPLDVDSGSPYDVQPAPRLQRWTLSPEQLLATMDARIRAKRSEALVAACQDMAESRGGLLYIDVSLLRLLPAGFLSESEGHAISALVQAQVGLLRDQKFTPTSPLARFEAPQFDVKRLGFVVSASNCAQGGLAAVPFCLAEVNTRQQLVLVTSACPEPAEAGQVQSVFLQQMAMLCRALPLSDVPTLTQAADSHVKYVPDVCKGSQHQGKHPVLHMLDGQPAQFSNVMHALRQEVEKAVSLAQYLQRFQAWNTACITPETHRKWAAGLCFDLLIDAWPIKLDLLEKAELQTVMAWMQHAKERRYADRDSRYDNTQSSRGKGRGGKGKGGKARPRDDDRHWQEAKRARWDAA